MLPRNDQFDGQVDADPITASGQAIAAEGISPLGNEGHPIANRLGDNPNDTNSTSFATETRRGSLLSTGNSDGAERVLIENGEEVPTPELADLIERKYEGRAGAGYDDSISQSVTAMEQDAPLDEKALFDGDDGKIAVADGSDVLDQPRNDINELEQSLGGDYGSALTPPATGVSLKVSDMSLAEMERNFHDATPVEDIDSRLVDVPLAEPLVDGKEPIYDAAISAEVQEDEGYGSEADGYLLDAEEGVKDAAEYALEPSAGAIGDSHEILGGEGYSEPGSLLSQYQNLFTLTVLKWARLPKRLLLTTTKPFHPMVTKPSYPMTT